MKKITLLLFLTTILLTNISCDPEPVLEDVTDVELTFKGKFGDQTFLINDESLTYNNMNIRYDQFNFYISNVVLVRETTSGQEETELLEIDFVDLSFTSSELTDAQIGYNINVKNVPVGEYDGIKIGLGVPADLNKNSWGDFGEGHPLRKVGHHWAAWESFIFSKTEASLDVDNDGGFVHKLSFHTGDDRAYRTKYIAKQIDLTKDEITNLTLEVDVKEMFNSIDIIQNTGTHNLSDIELVEEVMDNLQNKVLRVQ